MFSSIIAPKMTDGFSFVVEYIWVILKTWRNLCPWWFSHMTDFHPFVFLSVTLYDAMCHKNKILCQVPDNVVWKVYTITCILTQLHVYKLSYLYITCHVAYVVTDISYLLLSKQSRPSSDSSYKRSLIWVTSVCKSVKRRLCEVNDDTNCIV